MVLGAYFFYGFKVERELNTFVALIVTMIAIIALGAIVNIVIFYRLVGASLFTIVIATLALSLLLETIALII